MKSLFKEFPSAIRPYFIDILLIIFLCAYSLVGMWNFGINMATLHEDDGPIFYAFAFKDPSLFAGDTPIGFPLSLLVPLKVITSAMVWIPAMSWKYFDLDPFLSTGLLTLLQGFLLGLSIYIFSLALIGKKTVAFIVTVFAYGASPWTWAPAGFGNISTFHFLPYAATLATSPVLLAFACLLKKRVLPGLFLLASAGFIHPGITLHACIITGIYLLLRGMEEPSRASTIRYLAGLSVVVLVTALPSLWVQTSINFDPLDTAETMAGMKQNQHLWPWGFKNRWYLSAAVMVTWTLFAILSLRRKIDFTDGASTLCLSAFVGACLMGFSQIIGGFFENPFLLNFLGLRSFRWFVLISLPLIVNYWYAHLRSGTLVGIMSALICFTVPFFVREYAAFWFSPLIFAFLFLDVSEGRLSLWRFSLGKTRNMIFAILAVSASLFGFFAIPFINDICKEHSTQLQQVLSKFIWPLGVVNLSHFILFISVISILGLLLRQFGKASQAGENSESPGPPEAQVSPGGGKYFATTMSVLIVAYSLLFLTVEWQATAKQSTMGGRSLIDAQIWAKQNTPSTSVFVVPSSGWRAMSMRRKFDPFSRESYAYVAPRQAKEHRDRLLRFYGISEDEGRRLRGYGPGGVYALEVNRFFEFDESDFPRFASEFGATHLVLPSKSPLTQKANFALPVAYQNSHFMIYRLAVH